jgi:RAT1-interacting protein
MTRSTSFDWTTHQSDITGLQLYSLLKTIIAHEQELEKPVEADLITWRGMMTKVSFEFQLETSSFSVEYTKS